MAYHRKNSGVNSVYWKNSAVNAKQPQKERRCFTRRKRSVLLSISAVIPAFFPLLLAQKWPPFFELRSERRKISRKNRICCFSLTKHFSCFGLTEPVGRLSFEHWNLVNSFSDVMVLIPTRHTVENKLVSEVICYIRSGVLISKRVIPVNGNFYNKRFFLAKTLLVKNLPLTETEPSIASLGVLNHSLGRAKRILRPFCFTKNAVLSKVSNGSVLACSPSLSESRLFFAGF